MIILVIKMFFVQFFCVFLLPLNIFSSVRSIPFLSFMEPIFAKYSLGISNFLEEISSLSYSVVFLYFFALIAEEGFLIPPCYSLELCIQMGISFLFASLRFIAICKASSDSHFGFLHFFFLEMVLIPVSCTMSWTSIHSSSGTLSEWLVSCDCGFQSVCPLMEKNKRLMEAS